MAEEGGRRDVPGFLAGVGRLLVAGVPALLAGPCLLLDPVAATAQPVPRADSLFAVGMAYFQRGRFGEAAGRLETAAELRPHSSRRAYNAAVAHGRAGQPDRALRWLRRVADLGAYHPLDVRAFDALRERPGYEELVKRFEEILRPVARGSPAFRIGPPDLLPTSLAHDPVEDVFYLGSSYRRQILRIDPSTGGATEMAPRQGARPWSVLGLAVDAGRRELWVTSCNLGRGMPMAEPEPESVGRTVVHRFPLGGAGPPRTYAAGSAGDSVCFNDVAVREDGTVFLSAGEDGVHRIRPGPDRLELLVGGPGLRARGLDLSPDGSVLYFSNGDRGPIRVEIATGHTEPLELPEGVTLNGTVDLHAREGSLVAIQPGHSPPRVVQAFLDPSGRRVKSIRVLDSNHPAYAGPASGTTVADTLYYVATGQLRRAFGPDGSLRFDALVPNVVLATPLPPGPDAPRPASATEGPGR